MQIAKKLCSGFFPHNRIRSCLISKREKNETQLDEGFVLKFMGYNKKLGGKCKSRKSAS